MKPYYKDDYCEICLLSDIRSAILLLCSSPRNTSNESRMPSVGLGNQNERRPPLVKCGRFEVVNGFGAALLTGVCTGNSSADSRRWRKWSERAQVLVRIIGARAFRLLSVRPDQNVASNEVSSIDSTSAYRHGATCSTFGQSPKSKRNGFARASSTVCGVKRFSSAMITHAKNAVTGAVVAMRSNWKHITRSHSVGFHFYDSRSAMGKLYA